MNARISTQEVPKSLFTAMMQMEEHVNACGFSTRLLELVRLHVAQLNGCAYCIDMHYKEALAAGDEALRLYSLSAWRDTGYYSDEERAVLAWVEEVTLIDCAQALEPAFTQLSRFFDKPQVAQLTLAIAQINSWTRLAKSFGFVPGQYTVQ